MNNPAITLSDTYWIFFKREEHWVPGDSVSFENIRKITKSGAHIRTISRYFNAVSVEIDDKIDIREYSSEIMHIQPVRRFVRVPFPHNEKSSIVNTFAGNMSGHKLNYGASYQQLTALNIPALHDMGLTGAGIVIGVLDSGYDIDGIACLANLRVAHTWNFITGSEDVTGHSHGAYVLACLGGALDNKYYGVAFEAIYLLAVTDDIPTETRMDEDRWVAAVEWCDSLGADIISSSLVYNLFDSPEESYSKDDMDGRTSLVSQAAEIAVSHGIIVVNSAGNEGTNSDWRIITTPADAEHVIAVGAVSISDEGQPFLAGFSSRGPTADGRIKPDVVAPGDLVFVPYSKNYYSWISGTSIAAPFISGLCALILEVYPDWSPVTIMTALKETARDLGDPGPDNDYGWGIPDGVLALEYRTTGLDYNEIAQSTRYKMRKRQSYPSQGMLSDPFPNPFNAVLTIPFNLNKEALVTVDIIDITGRIVEQLWNEVTNTGTHYIMWETGLHASGTYVVRAKIGMEWETKKVLLIK